MKYIQIVTLLILTLSIGFQNIQTTMAQAPSGSGTKVYVTEPVIGADCKCVVNEGGEIKDPLICPVGITKRLYECTVPEGSAGFRSIFKAFIQWIAVIATLLGVLALVALGIAWAVAGGEDSSTKKFLKEWIQNIIIGLLILYTFGFILRFLAPWVFTA